MSDSLEFTVPLVPPSVNHYKKPRGRGHGYYVTAEAEAFKRAVALCARGQSVSAKTYELEARVYLGHKQRGDGDNFWKVISDALVEARCIHSDAAVVTWILHKARDRANPRTEILILAKEQHRKAKATP